MPVPRHIAAQYLNPESILQPDLRTPTAQRIADGRVLYRLGLATDTRFPETAADRDNFQVNIRRPKLDARSTSRWFIRTTLPGGSLPQKRRASHQEGTDAVLTDGRWPVAVWPLIRLTARRGHRAPLLRQPGRTGPAPWRLRRASPASAPRRPWASSWSPYWQYPSCTCRSS
jgi:hypothetical protein